MPTPKRKRQTISIKIKKQLIDAAAANPKKSYADLAKEFSNDQLKLTKPNIQTILGGKDKILNAIDDGIDEKRARLTNGRHADIEAAVLTWFRQIRGENIAVSGPLLKEKALKLAEELGIEDFKASEGWLDNFKERHSIKFRSEQGEAAEVDMEVVENWQQTILRDALVNYSPENVFNADETGLFWKVMPNKTLTFKGEKCIGGKKSKERVTVLVGSNASGTEKLPLFVIGKSAKPRCFKNARLPVEYAANKKAWMTGDFFEEWLKKWDKRLKIDDRKILLFLDNCSAHPKIKLQNIELKFLPPNTTAASQPMDQGIIQNIKVHYRKRLIRRRIAAIDSGTVFTFNLLDAVFLLRQAWNQVTSTTIASCFRKAGFVFNELAEIQIEEIEDVELVNDWSTLQGHSEVGANCEISDYLAIDTEVLTSGALTLKEIAQASLSSNADEAESEDEAANEIEERPPITGAAARQAYLQLRHFCQENGLDEKLYSAFDQVEDFLLKNQIAKMKQQKISDFFIPR